VSSISPFQRITISNSEILDYPATWRILKNLGTYNLLPPHFEEPEIVDTHTMAPTLAFQALKESQPHNTAVALGKRILHLTTQKGLSVKACPGTNHMVCCQYHVINMISNCPFDCSYCYLQTYLNQPMTTIYVNEEDILSQVVSLCKTNQNLAGAFTAEGRTAGTRVGSASDNARCAGDKKQPFRIGTGELSDSLALDPITEFSKKLAFAMAEFENVRLELKTKSKNVEHLLDLPRKDHVVIAWSINPAEIIEREEHKTARFDERLRAAVLAAKAGFHVAFHFDPMIYCENWKEIYSSALDEIIKQLPQEKIQWMTIGGLRYQPQLKPIAYKRYPQTTLFEKDSVLAEDGKVRYLRTIRTQMFQFLYQKIKKDLPQTYTYLCMESKPVWENVVGHLPERSFSVS